ncbi:MAG: homocysteine S-methyltransferase family protein [Bacteroidota bacterium]
MPAKSILNKLPSQVLVCDGAMGTELQSRGLPSGSCPEEYNVTHPEVVEEILRGYLEAGADILTTNSFGANRPRLKEYGYESRVKEFCKRSVEIARELSQGKCYIAGSLGPTGQILEPLGPVLQSEAAEAFQEQADALAKAGADLILIETMMSIDEAELAVKAAKGISGLVVAATMSFEVGPKGARTLWGVDIPTAVSRLTAAGADIIGSNCGQGFDDMVRIVQEMRPLTPKPLIAQPNAGLPQWVDGRPVYSETPTTIRPKVEALLRSGANIVGGCCGTTAEHIRIIRKIVDTVKGSHLSY